MLEHKILSIIKRINLIEERIQKIENRFRKKNHKSLFHSSKFPCRLFGRNSDLC